MKSEPKDYDPFDDMQDADRYDAVPVVGIIVVFTAVWTAACVAIGYWIGSC